MRLQEQGHERPQREGVDLSEVRGAPRQGRERREEYSTGRDIDLLARISKPTVRKECGMHRYQPRIPTALAFGVCQYELPIEKARQLVLD